MDVYTVGHWFGDCHSQRRPNMGSYTRLWHTEGPWTLCMNSHPLLFDRDRLLYRKPLTTTSRVIPTYISYLRQSDLRLYRGKWSGGNPVGRGSFPNHPTDARSKEGLAQGLARVIVGRSLSREIKFYTSHHILPKKLDLVKLVMCNGFF